MLSRVAERLYWMARYLERAEDTARLTGAYSHLILDIPRGAAPGWELLVNILDAQPVFHASHRVHNEKNVMAFLLDEDNGSSIRSCVRMVRENVRTTRDVLPEEVWEYVNELYLYTEDAAGRSVGRRNRYEFLEQVTARCQLINGVIMTTMSRDHAKRFIKLGRLLERADMTSRVIDVGAAAILQQRSERGAMEALLWGTLLQALSALGAYRRSIGPEIDMNAVTDFILGESSLPRSISFCLQGLSEELVFLKNHDSALRDLRRASGRLSRFRAANVSAGELHRFLDDLQLGFSQLHDTLTETWFHPGNL